MTTGERMKARRKELHIRAEDVAEVLGVSAATIYRYEKGDIEKVPIEALGPLAKVLHTNSYYLMGFSDDPSELSEFAEVGRSEYEDRMIRASSKLNSYGKEKLLDYAEDLTQIPKYQA